MYAKNLTRKAQICREAEQRIEASWLEWCVVGMHPDACSYQVEAMRKAYICGAMFMFAQMEMAGERENGKEIVGSLIKELDTFAGEMLMGDPEGSA
jgi:hypothetical protein